MPKVNLKDTPDSGDFTPFAVIDAPARVSEIRLRESSDESEQWGLKIEIVDGEYAGRVCWDNLTWPRPGVIDKDGLDETKGKRGQRIQVVAKAFGLPTDGEFEYEPKHFLGAYDTIDKEGETRWIGNGSGPVFLVTTEKQVQAKGKNKGKEQTKVPFAGYKQADDASGKDDIAPF